MISTVKATMHKVVGAMADDLLPPRDLANAAFAVMVWASSKMSAKERDKLLNGFSIAIRDRGSSTAFTGLRVLFVFATQSLFFLREPRTILAFGDFCLS